MAAHHARYAPKGTIDPDELARLVGLGLTARELARALEVSESTVSYWLRKLGLRTTRGVARAQAGSARRAGAQTLAARCEKHGVVDLRINIRGNYRCPYCASESVAARRRRVKEILVAEAGGCCRRCGFSEHPAALHFHHLDRATKAFSLSAAGVTRSLARSRAEAAKCVLLCSNCHALVEAGVASV